jgi:hypothetical protein
VANVIFLESPAGVGFSFSRDAADYKTAGDRRTAEDTYIFLVNWLERFPEYKGRELYVAGESYGGHFVPQAATVVTLMNRRLPARQTPINLRGIFVSAPNNLSIDHRVSTVQSIQLCCAFTIYLAWQPVAGSVPLREGEAGVHVEPRRDLRRGVGEHPPQLQLPPRPVLLQRIGAHVRGREDGLLQPLRSGLPPVAQRNLLLQQPRTFVSMELQQPHSILQYTDRY